MEVESRVSVQAMRGKFEQKPEAIKLCLHSPGTNVVTSPGRARTSSLIISDKDKSSHNGAPGGRLANSVNKENDCSTKAAKHSPNSVSKTKSIFSEIVSPMLSGSKMTKALSPKKHSVDNIKSRKISSEKSDVNEDSLKGTPSRKVSENFTSDTKPSVVRRIPVFKSSNGAISSEARVPVETESTEGKVDSPSRRQKFLGHIRSRSHGNFMINRDSSAERNESSSSTVGNTVKLEHVRMNFFDRKNRQKSSDNLYGHKDMKSSSPFEGKQKIVANVVKNMKNKEKPKVLRKFSFSSKTEKEIKNKKEKASPDKDQDKLSSCADHSAAKMEAIAKLTVKEKLSSVSGIPVGGSGTVSIAKAVADIALIKNSSRSPESHSNTALVKEASKSPEAKSKGTPTPGEISPPARPPRRRSATLGLLPHKKGIAPSPPGPLVSHNQGTKATSSESHNHDISISPGSSFDSEVIKTNLSSTFHKSMDPLLSPRSSDVSGESSLAITSLKSPVLLKQKSKSSITVDKLKSEDYCTCDDEPDSKGYSSKPPSGKKPEKIEHLDNEPLPNGPPPRKPPRTFAYDIYKSTKENKSEELATVENENDNETLEISSPSALPVYAVPLKKKKSENKVTPKPPVRSNSDLSKRDLTKPSVAPKPPHILNKVKRTSVVDPLSCTEKGEEAAMTSEFQRQAHIRYSLRRPKKPPPAPPPNLDSEENILNDKAKNSKEMRGSSIYTGLSNNCDMSDDDYGSGSSPHVTNDSRSSPTNSVDFTASSRCSPDSVYSDGDDIPPSLRITSRSSYNLHVPNGFNCNEPLSLGHCPTDTSELAGLYRKRSMSDETLYKGSKYGEEPIYAMPIFTNSKGSRGHNRQRELHYMCSVLFTDEGADGGRDGCQRNGRDGETPDGTACKVKSSIISVWKREFRQSCRQVHNKIKKTVNR